MLGYKSKKSFNSLKNNDIITNFFNSKYELSKHFGNQSIWENLMNTWIN